ncbi:MAG: hypothetical protein M3Z32_07020 [Acidobacteriota bacterium]|nr:hypothetical protein [Acidobacteriota bacterium]
MGELHSESFHDRDRVEQAILALSQPELLRLKKYAVWRIRGLGRKARGRNHEDLLNEAVTSIVEGIRPWRRSILFYVHLRGCIRSISNAWSQKNDVDLWFESEIDSLVTESKTARVPLYQGARDDQPTPEERAHVNLQLDRVHRLFPCGTTDRQIIDCWANGQNHSEAQAELGLSKNMYDAAVKRIRRTAASKRAFVYGEEYV